jgi:hypothetical protein
MPHANSTTSMPRSTLPVASGSVLPCSSETIRASSVACARSSPRAFCSTRARRCGEVSRQAGNAAFAARTAVSMSARVAIGARRITFPVAGFVMSPVRVLAAGTALPPIQNGSVSRAR